ncbi:MAG: hypothetical protein O3B13_01280 [Planctomycetota bacterium]|nr:hypothetical protein [Planctomycetota bacterium]
MHHRQTKFVGIAGRDASQAAVRSEEFNQVIAGGVILQESQRLYVCSLCDVAINPDLQCCRVTFFDQSGGSQSIGKLLVQCFNPASRFSIKMTGNIRADQCFDFDFNRFCCSL